MTNVTNLFQNASVFGDYGRADFDIATGPLQYFDAHGNVKRASKEIIYRTDTGEELGIHGSRYKPVAPKQMIDATRKIIMWSNLNTAGIEETIATSHHGRRTFVKYKLPSHTYTTPDGDTAALCLLALTSFDSKWPFMISVAAEQFACTNLQVFTTGEIAVYKSKHVQSLDIDHGSRVIVKALDVVNEQQEQWHQWYNTHIHAGQAARFIANFTNTGAELDELYEGGNLYAPLNYGYHLKRNNTSVNYLCDAYKGYADRMGHNLWAMYNAFTDWSTHAKFSKRVNYDTIASATNDRQEKVRKFVTTNFRMAA
jgi:hypothetical protein